MGGIYRSVIVLFTCVVFYASDLFLMKKYDCQRPSGGTAMRLLVVVSSLVGVAFLLLQPVIWPGLGIHIDRWWGLAMQVIGILLQICGLGMYVWARLNLGEFFCQQAEIQEQHRLVESGPYQYVRHPIFTSFFVIGIGVLLLNPSLVTVIVVVSSIVIFVRSARQDEEMLSEHVPGYEAYMERTPRFFPRLRW